MCLQSTDHLVLQYRSTYFKGWISGVAYNASLPILFLSYVQNQFFPNNSENWALHYGILVGITVVLTFVNYRGLEVVGSVSVLIFFLTMAPFVLLVFIGIPKGKNVMMNWYADNIIHSPRIIWHAVDPTKWLQTPSVEVDTVDENSLDNNGWFPLPNLAGIACEYYGSLPMSLIHLTMY